jgi:hypothetical protein
MLETKFHTHPEPHANYKGKTVEETTLCLMEQYMKLHLRNHRYNQPNFSKFLTDTDMEESDVLQVPAVLSAEERAQV